MKSLLKRTLICSLFFTFQFTIFAQNESAPILFIYDASGSMWGQMEGKTKKEIAADVLSIAVKKLDENQKIGLMAYGHRVKDDCRDIELLFDLGNNSKENIINAVKKLNPIGQTPLAQSATLAINSLRDSKTKATIILVTDGIETCDGNICDVVSAAKLEGIDFKLHIIGFGLKESETEQLKCAANAGGGKYYHVGNASDLTTVLNEATVKTIYKNDHNYSIYAVKNGKPVDAWVIAYKTGTRNDVDGSRTYRDTAHIFLPPGKYDIAIKPLEGSDVSGTTIQVDIKEGEFGHQTVSFDGASLNVFTTNNNEGCDAIVKMYDKNTGQVVASVRTYSRMQTMEVNPGTYNITFEALQIKGIAKKSKIENVEILAGETKSLEQNFETGFALIGVKTSSGKLIDATVNFNEISTGEWVAASRTYTSENSNPKKFLLNSGTYTVKIVTLGVHKGNSETFNVTVKTGETVEKIITY